MKHHSLLFLLLAATLPAQQSDLAFLPWLGSNPGMAGERSAVAPTARPLPTTFAVNRGAGLQLLDGELWGAAHGYKVLFTADGFEFTPVLGPTAPRNYPLTFRMASCGRGGEIAPVAAGERRHDGLRVEYDRGNVVERYDVGTEAMEQSFVFARRPAGHGDLVVRGQLQTDMVVTPENGGLRIEQPGVGGFHLGAVTGIDANGVRVPGTVRYENGMLELSLPAGFVDRAALPFVLDPPIGTTFGVTAGSSPDLDAEVAFDVTNNCYLVVWTRLASSTDGDIVGQRVLRSGGLLGNLVLVEVSTAASDFEATVASFNGRNAFVVAYTRTFDIRGRSVAAVNGTVSLAITIAGGGSNQTSASLGGDSVNVSVPIANFGVCVWRDNTAAALQATRVILNPDLSLGVAATVHTLMLGTAVSPARISKSGGAAGRYAVVFSRFLADTDPLAMVVNSSGAPLTAPISLDTGATNALQPQVDGNGSNWLVAWEDSDQSSARIKACSITLAGNPSGLVAAPSLFVDNGGPGQIQPSVMWTGASAVIAHADGFSPQSDVVLHSVDPFQCLLCEGRFPLPGGNDLDPAGCSTLSGGGPQDDGLVAWTNAIGGDILAAHWRSADGIATTVQGGCGLGGTALATCARVGNANFTHRLRGTTPSAVTVLIQSLSQGSMTCNSCTLAPALSGSVASLFVVDVLGNAAFPAAIPNNPALGGLQLFEQWLTLRPGGACSTYDIDLSNALRIVIE